MSSSWSSMCYKHIRGNLAVWCESLDEYIRHLCMYFILSSLQIFDIFRHGVRLPPFTLEAASRLTMVQDWSLCEYSTDKWRPKIVRRKCEFQGWRLANSLLFPLRRVSFIISSVSLSKTLRNKWTTLCFGLEWYTSHWCLFASIFFPEAKDKTAVVSWSKSALVSYKSMVRHWVAVLPHYRTSAFLLTPL